MDQFLFSQGGSSSSSCNTSYSNPKIFQSNAHLKTTGKSHLRACSSLRKQRKSKKDGMTSYKVFQQFVKEVDGKESGEDIISKECYDKWVESRHGNVLHPEESFKRILISHIRGAYNRKPFKKDIEASLLKVLRHVTDEEGNTINPWEKCFDVEALHLGKRAFTNLGYHEANKIKGEHEDKKFHGNSIKTEYGPVLSSSPSIYSLKTEPQSVKEEAMILARTMPFPSRPRHLSVIKKQEVDQLYDMVKLADGGSGWLEELAKVFTSFHSRQDLEMISESAASSGYSIIPKSCSFFLRDRDLANDPRFDFNFLMPSIDECFFWPGRSVGRFGMDQRTWRVCDCDEEAANIFGRNIVGEHCFEIYESALELLMVYIKTKPRMQLTGESWHRLRIRKGVDGFERSGCLCNVVQKPDAHSFVYIQEQPEAYADLLDVPMFV